MVIDLRESEEEVRDDLRVLRPTTQNNLVTYLKKKGIDFKKVEEIHLGDGGMKAREAAGLAANMSKMFGAVVHFECRGSPGTSFPSLRLAALKDYERRRSAGERVLVHEDDQDE